VDNSKRPTTKRGPERLPLKIEGVEFDLVTADDIAHSSLEKTTVGEFSVFITLFNLSFYLFIFLSLSMSVSISLSISLSLSICLCICVSLFITIFLSIYLYLCLCLYLYLYLCSFLSLYLSV